MKTIDSIISENKKRNANLFGYYDPIFGVNSDIERFPSNVFATQEQLINIPFSMLEIDLIQDVIDAGDTSLEDIAGRRKGPRQTTV